MLVRHAEEITADLTRTVSVIQREIELVRKYHARLISDVVTGQLDIRNAPLEPLEAALESTEAEPSAIYGGDEAGEELEVEVAVGDE